MDVTWKNENERSDSCYYGAVEDNVWLTLCQCIKSWPIVFLM